jgi:hypothetical protein
MNQTQPSRPGNTGAFSAIWRTLGLGISLTTLGSALLAVFFAFALDGCTKVAGNIKSRPPAASMTASAQPRPLLQ